MNTARVDHLLAPLALLVFGAAVLVLVLRSGTLGGRPKAGSGAFRPDRAKRPRGASRFWDALLTASVGAALLFMVMTEVGYGGSLLELRAANPAFARLHSMLTLISAGLLAACVFLVWRGAAALGAMLAAAVVTMAWALVFGRESFLTQRALERTPPEARQGTVELAIELAEQIPGAELWVNGVRLGAMPYRTTLREFQDAVPRWDAPPSDCRTDLAVTRREFDFGSSGVSSDNGHRWIKLEMPRAPKRTATGLSSEIRSRTVRRDAESPLYYARVRLGDEWGAGSALQGFGGSLVERFRWSSACSLSVVFPEAETRLCALIDKARLADYRVDGDWLAAAQSYGEVGWRRLRKAAETDPRLNEVLDAWARSKYGLDSVRTADEAWAAFRRIREDVDRAGRYDTADATGRAVEILSPKLDPERLCDEAVKELDSRRNYGFGHRAEFGRLQFSYSSRDRSPASGYYSPGAYALAHAVWMLHERTRPATEADAPSLVQRRVVPALMRHGYLSDPNLRLAAYLGGPDIWRFLTRHDWRETEGLQFGRENAITVGGNKTANRWFHLMANSPAPEAREFRRRNAGAVLNMAENLIDDFSGGLDDLSFLFLDLDRGDESLAMQFWPRYRDRMRSLPDHSSWDTIRRQWRYLARMEPLPNVDAYVECWKSLRGASFAYQQALGVFVDLPREKAATVARALEKAVREDGSNVQDAAGWAVEEIRDDFVRAIERQRCLAMDKEALARLEGEILQPDAEERRTYISDWMRITAPDHPMVEEFARSADPRLRILTIGALRALPTPEHRELLAELARDPDPPVRQQAEEAREALERLAASSPSEWALQ